MKRFLLSALLVLGLSVPTFAAQDRAVDDVDGAIAFVQDLGDKTIEILNDMTSSKQDRSDKFRVLFHEALDINIVTRALLGRHYRKVRSEGLVPAYQDAVTNYIITEFEQNIQLVGILGLTIDDTRPAPGQRGELMVRTTIDVNEGDDVIADWRLQKKNGVFSIINMEVLGYNFIVTGRSLFGDRISALGFEGHIAELNDKYKPANSSS